MPATLAQWARCEGIALDEDSPSITPARARELLLAATNMAPALRDRALSFAAGSGLSVERVCYLLLSGIWKPIELDFMLACSPRAHDMLLGGSDALNRPRRDAEEQVAVAAAMLGGLHQRVQNNAADQPQVVEDDRQPVSWEVIEALGAVKLSGLCDALPWTGRALCPESVLVLPRLWPDSRDDMLTRVGDDAAQVVVLVPADAEIDEPAGVVVLRHPDRLAALLRSVGTRFANSRVGRR